MKLVSPPIIEKPQTSNILVPIVAQDMTMCIMRLEQFIFLIAESKENAEVIIEEVKKALDELGGDIANVDITTKEGIAQLKLIVNEHERAIKDLKEADNALSGRIDDLKTKVDSHSGSISTINQEINGIKETLQDHEERIKALEDKVNGTASYAKANRLMIESLVSKVNSNTERHNELEKLIRGKG